MLCLNRCHCSFAVFVCNTPSGNTVSGNNKTAKVGITSSKEGGSPYDSE